MELHDKNRLFSDGHRDLELFPSAQLKTHVECDFPASSIPLDNEQRLGFVKTSKDLCTLSSTVPTLSIRPQKPLPTAPNPS